MFDFLQIAHQSSSKLLRFVCFWCNQFVFVCIAYVRFRDAGFGFRTFPIVVTTSDIIQFFAHGLALRFVLEYVVALCSCYLALFALGIVAMMLNEAFNSKAQLNPLSFLVSKKVLLHDTTLNLYYRGPEYSATRKNCLDKSGSPRASVNEENDSIAMSLLLIAFVAFYFYGLRSFTPYAALFGSFSMIYRYWTDNMILHAVRKVPALFSSVALPPDKQL